MTVCTHSRKTLKFNNYIAFVITKTYDSKLNLLLHNSVPAC